MTPDYVAVADELGLTPEQVMSTPVFRDRLATHQLLSVFESGELDAYLYNLPHPMRYVRGHDHRFNGMTRWHYVRWLVDHAQIHKATREIRQAIRLQEQDHKACHIRLIQCLSFSITTSMYHPEPFILETSAKRKKSTKDSRRT